MRLERGTFCTRRNLQVVVFFIYKRTHLFAVWFMASESQSVYHQMIGQRWIIHYKTILKESVVVLFTYSLGIYLEGLRKIVKNVSHDRVSRQRFEPSTTRNQA